LRGGSLSVGSELILEIAELDVENLLLNGSLQILAAQPLGAIDEEGILQYSHRVGRAILQNVTVENAGVDWTRGTPYWKMNLQHKETVIVELKGWSEFDARDVHLEGSHHFIVEEGVKMTVRQGEDGIVVTKTPISKEWLWNYSWKEGVILDPGS